MKKNWLAAAALGIVAAVLYFASLAEYAFPGESAGLIAAWNGLELAPGNRYPLMAFFAKLFGGGNLLAPVCGVVAVSVWFLLVRAFFAWRADGEESRPQKETVANLAAATAAVVFMLSPAVRSAATHLEPRLFAFVWLLLTVSAAVPFFRIAFGCSWLCPLLVGSLAAAGSVDSPLFVAMAPALAALAAIVPLHHRRKPYLALFVLTLSAFATLLVALKCADVAFADWCRQTAAGLRDYCANPGWLFVLTFATLPFATMLFSSNKAFGEKPTLVHWLFHGAMSFVAVLAVATPLSPSALMAPYGILPVATSAFASAVAGYLVAFWWLNRRSVVALASGGALAFVLLVTMLWNLFSFDGDSGAFADRVAEKIIRDLDGRTWLVTDGTLDSHLQIVAKRMGKEIRLVSLARDLDESYLEELGELVRAEGVGGSKNNALLMSLKLGVLPFVQDWFASDPSVAKEAAVYGAPDLWYSAGLKPVPEFLFFGADDSRKPDWSDWKEFDAVLKAPKGWGSYRDRNVTDPVDRLRFAVRRHLGMVANNRGVYLQDRKDDAGAFAMYELVLNEIDRDNICALFNEVEMVGQNHPSAKAKQRELERTLKVVAEDKNRRYILWRLGTYYGYIRNPDTFVRLGIAWARSGRPGDALSQIRRAIDFVPSDKRWMLMNMMAALYASGSDTRRSRMIYEAMLKRQSDDHDALIGMMRIELQSGNVAKAIDYLQRAAAVSKSGKQHDFEMAMLSMMKGEHDRARQFIKKITDAESGDMQAWSLLAAVSMQQIDATKDEAARKKLMRELEEVTIPAMEKHARDKFDYYLLTTKGYLHLRRGDAGRQQAREAFVAASRTRPDMAITQDLVLGLDISLNDRESAAKHARETLRRNRNAPLANYVMGSIALGEGKYGEAEAYLRKAADAPQPVALALNDLAEVLRRGKNYAEAERYARKAVEVAPAMYVAWETLGSVLVDANRSLDEAESAIRKACELSRDKDGRESDVRMLVSLARVQIKNGDRERAKVTVRKVQQRLGELSEFERQEFEAVAKSVR